MTKKSASRVIRDNKKIEVDNYFKQNKVFDDLLDIHEKISANLAQFGMISQLAGNQELIARLDNHADTNEKIRLLAKDLTRIIADLNTTFDSHKDRSGGADNPDEYMWALTTFQNYSQIASVVEGAIIPTAATIYEAFAVAEKKLLKEIQDSKTTEQDSVVDSNSIKEVV